MCIQLKISRSIPSYQTTMYLTSGENVKTDNFQSVPESTIFNQSRLNPNEARLETSVYTRIKFERYSLIASYQTRLHKELDICKND